MFRGKIVGGEDFTMPTPITIQIDDGEALRVQPIVQYPVMKGIYMIFGQVLTGDQPTGEWISMTYGDTPACKGVYVREFRNENMVRVIQDLFSRTPGTPVR